MRLTREIKQKIQRELTDIAFPAGPIQDAGMPIVEYMEKTIPFQKAVKALNDYPDFVHSKDMVHFVVGYHVFRYMSRREAIFHTSKPYAAKVDNEDRYGIVRPITFSIDDDDIKVAGLYNRETALHIDDDLMIIGRPLFDMLLQRVDFEEIVENTLSTTTSLGKLISLIPVIQTLFPDEKPLKITDTEKRLSTPEELAFVNRRLEIALENKIR